MKITKIDREKLKFSWQWLSEDERINVVRVLRLAGLIIYGLGLISGAWIGTVLITL